MTGRGSWWTTRPSPGWVNSSEHNGKAFCEILEHLPTDGHGGNVVTLLVGLDLDALLTGIGAAQLDTGTRISAADARRLACEAGLVPAVLGGASVPLDLGRERRLHSKGQRQALSTVHDSCAVAGCCRCVAITIGGLTTLVSTSGSTPAATGCSTDADRPTD